MSDAAEAGDELGTFRTATAAWWWRLWNEPVTYELTRFAVLRLLALVYLVAFLALALQLDPLLGSHGLLPIATFLPRVHQHLGAAAYWKLPTLLWLADSDRVMHVLCWTGVVLSAAALLGATNAILQLALWAIYLSFVHAGQIFYGYGWEIQLLETGMLAVFLCPVRSLKPLPGSRAPKLVVWLLRWLVFRVMVGAVLIKLRNDSCWRDLSCLDYHFETQPNPGPLAWWAHHAPHAVHVAGVVFNHLAEGLAPWFIFGFRRWRHAAGAVLVVFQATLIASGNLSFLNWLTIVPALACFDDSFWMHLVPRARRAAMLGRFEALRPGRWQGRVVGVYGVVVGLLSVGPVMNLFASDQAMNTSFEPFDLVNTYGAFGTVDRRRYEIVLEGTRDATPDATAHWQEYELPCMPGDVRRRPCFITPYHDRLDWQMWFAGNDAARGESIDDEPWLVHLVWQLLHGDPSPEKLLARNPFAGGPPPRWIRADVWRYWFSATRAGGKWWNRERVRPYLDPVAADDPGLAQYVRAYGWDTGRR